MPGVSFVGYLSSSYEWAEGFFYRLLPTHCVSAPALLADGLAEVTVHGKAGDPVVAPGADFDGLWVSCDPARPGDSAVLVGAAHGGSSRQASLPTSDELVADWAATRRRKFRSGWTGTDKALIWGRDPVELPHVVWAHVLRTVGSSTGRAPRPPAGLRFPYGNIQSLSNIGYCGVSGLLTRLAIAWQQPELLGTDFVLDRMTRESWVPAGWGHEDRVAARESANRLWWELFAEPILRRSPLDGTVRVAQLTYKDRRDPEAAVLHLRPNGQLALYGASELKGVNTLALGRPAGFDVSGPAHDRLTGTTAESFRLRTAPTPDLDTAITVLDAHSVTTVDTRSEWTEPTTTWATLADLAKDFPVAV